MPLLKFTHYIEKLSATDDVIARRVERFVMFAGQARLAGIISRLLSDQRFVELHQISNAGDAHHNLSVIIGLYNFDRQLRLATFNVVQLIEIDLRNRLCKTLAASNGRDWLLNPSAYEAQWSWISRLPYDQNADHDATDAQKKKNIVRALRYAKFDYYQDSNYRDMAILKLIDKLSFGELISLYEIINTKDKAQMAGYFNVQPNALKSLYYSMAGLRNHIAHHNMLLSANIPNTPPAGMYDGTEIVKSERFFERYKIIRFFLRKIHCIPHFRYNLDRALLSVNDRERGLLGFPALWDDHYFCKKRQSRIFR